MLDTHVLIWWRSAPERLSRRAEAALRRARASARESDGVAVASATVWELAWLIQRGTVKAVGTLQSAVEQYLSPVNLLPLTPEIAALAAQFGAAYPPEPMDRIIGATALAHGLVLVTRDEAIRRSGLVHTLW